MDEVVRFLKEELNWSQDKTFVFGGKYSEFILLLDYRVNNERFLLADGWNRLNVGENMFVEYSSSGIHELKDATLADDEGYLVIKYHPKIILESGNYLRIEDKNFEVYGKSFIFIKNINGFRIYKWTS